MSNPNPNSNPSSDTATRPFAVARASPAQQQPAHRPLAPLLHQQHHHNPYHHHHQLYTYQNFPIRQPNAALAAALNKPFHHQDPSNQSQGLLYPVASSGRGFMTRPLRSPQDPVTVANHGGYQGRPVLAYRPIGSPHTDPVHLIRANQPQHHSLFQQRPHLGHPTHVSSPIKGMPLSIQSKVVPNSSPVPDVNANGKRNSRSIDDSIAVVRDRKVRITDGASLYSLCRSWLRNGVRENIQLQHGGSMRPMPRPLPMVETDSAKEKEEEEAEEEKEDERSVEHLEAKDLLERHIERAKKVRARLREEREKRIGRYRDRLTLLLPRNSGTE